MTFAWPAALLLPVLVHGQFVFCFGLHFYLQVYNCYVLETCGVWCVSDVCDACMNMTVLLADHGTVGE